VLVSEQGKENPLPAGILSMSLWVFSSVTSVCDHMSDLSYVGKSSSFRLPRPMSPELRTGVGSDL